MGTQTQVQTTQTQLPAWIEQAGQAAVTGAQKIAATPYRAYGSAAPTPAAPPAPPADQQPIYYGNADDRDGQFGGYTPGYVAAAATPQADQGPALDTSQFKYWDSGPIADLSDDEKKAIKGVEGAQGGWQPAIATAGSLIKGAAQGYGAAPTMDGGARQYTAAQADAAKDITTDKWNGAQADSYMSPYISKVLDKRMSNLQRQADIASRDRSLSEATTGNWGGARHGIADAEAGRNLLDQQDTSYASGMNDAWNQAQSAYSGDEGRSLDAQKATADNAIRVNLANAAAKNQASETNISNYLKQFNTDSDRTLSQFNADKTRSLDAGKSMIDVASNQSKLALGDADALAKAGGLSRSIDQAKRDFDVDQYTKAQNKPYQDTSLITGAISGTPTSKTETQSGTTKTPSNTLGNIAGIAGTIASFL